jgi:hypothetical protein
VTAEAIEWRYAGDPGVGVDDEANVLTLLDGRRIKSLEQLLAWLDELSHLRAAAPLDGS